MSSFEKEAVKERREFNKEIYEKIFKITGKPETIVDLGCGLNPIYFPYKNIIYYAVDNKKEVIKKVKKHFKKNKIQGKIIYLDLEKENPNLKVDVVFLFKVLDYLSKKRVKELIANLNADFIIASFPTKTISGRRMNNPRREWFENILKSLDLSWKNLRYFNEIFYIINKN